MALIDLIFADLYLFGNPFFAEQLRLETVYLNMIHLFYYAIFKNKKKYRYSLDNDPYSRHSNDGALVPRNNLRRFSAFSGDE